MTHEHALLVALGLATVALTLLAVVVCCVALVWLDAPLPVHVTAAVAAAFALSSLTLGAWRLTAGALASGRLRRSLELSPGPVVGGTQLEILADEVPRAFCVGLLAPKVVVSAGALAALDDARLAVVVAHERHHARRRDGLRRIAAEAVSASAAVLPACSAAHRRYDVLLELRADRAALADGGAASTLAGALLTFDGAGFGIEPERVDGLLRPGVPPAPVPGVVGQGSLLLLALGALVALVVVSTGWVDLLWLAGDGRVAERYLVLPILAASAGVLLVLRALVPDRGR